MTEQTSVPLDRQSKKRVDMQFAKMLIKSGLPAKVRKGRAMLKRLRGRQDNEAFTHKLVALRAACPDRLDAEGAKLLAERRLWFEKEIEKRNNGTRENESG